MEKFDRVYSLEEQKDMLQWLKKKNEMPTKYMYFGIGSKRFTAITRKRIGTDTKHIQQLEHMLLTEKVGVIFEALKLYGYKNFNIIDIGVGDAIPIFPIFQYLRRNMSHAGLRYNPIDISPDMLDAASKTIKETFEVFGEKNKWDLDKGNFVAITRKLNRPGYGNLYMFLGATLGNMPDITQDLMNIRESMRSDDYLLIGVELLKESDIGTLKEYYNAHELFDVLFTPFEYMGLRKSHFAYRVLFNRKLEQLEGYIVPDRDIYISLAGEHFLLKKNKEIMMFRSVRFRPEVIVTHFSKVGFRIEMMTTSRDNKYALILVQPTV